DKSQAQGGVFGIQSKVTAGGSREFSMCFFGRPLCVTKIDEQSVHAVSGGAGVELLRKPTQAREAQRDIDLSGAVEHMDVAVFEIAIEAHGNAVAGCRRSARTLWVVLLERPLSLRRCLALRARH